MSDFEKVYVFFLKIFEKTKKNLIGTKNNGKFSLISSNRPLDDHLDFDQIINPQAETDKIDFILPKGQENSEFALFSENEISGYFGNLIPVQSGHNGCLNEDENNILDFHLRNSGFIK